MKLRQIFLLRLSRCWYEQCWFFQDGQIHDRGVAASRNDQIGILHLLRHPLALQMRYNGEIIADHFGRSVGSALNEKLPAFQLKQLRDQDVLKFCPLWFGTAQDRHYPGALIGYFVRFSETALRTNIPGVVRQPIAMRKFSGKPGFIFIIHDPASIEFPDQMMVDPLKDLHR